MNSTQQTNIYLDELKNSIANWNYACDEAEEHQGQAGETSLHWDDARQDAANDVLSDYLNFSVHCAQNGLCFDAFWEWTDIALRIHTTQKQKRAE